MRVIIIILFISILIYIFGKNRDKLDYKRIESYDTNTIDTEYDYTALLKELGIITEEKPLFPQQWIEYSECLAEYTYDNFCRDMLDANTNFKREYGYASATINNKKRLFSIYKVVNSETEEFLYYIDKDGSKKFILSDITDSENVTFDNVTFTIHLYPQFTFLDFVDPFYSSYRYDYVRWDTGEKKYDFPFGFFTGYIQNENNPDCQFDLYKQVDNENWIYYIGDEKTIVPLEEYDNISDGDIIKTQFDDDSYKFYKTE